MAIICQAEERVLVTLDVDFSDIRDYPPPDYHGIIVLRLARVDKRRVLIAIRRLLTLLDQEPLVGKLWIVDETSVRIRSQTSPTNLNRPRLPCLQPLLFQFARPAILPLL